MSRLEVEIRTSPEGVDAAWRELRARAEPNVFMDPAGLAAMDSGARPHIHTLLAWDRRGSGRLVGLWALREMKLTPIGPAFLSGPPQDHAFLSNPVIDPEHVHEAVAGFVAAIAAHPRLPKVLKLRYLDGDAPTTAPLLDALAANAAGTVAAPERPRPFVSRAGGLKRSGSTRKKLRQDWNRLSALGSARYANERGPAAVVAGFESFLALEAESWKGRRGTALLSEPRSADQARRFIGALAGRGDASVARIEVDGRPIAAQVILYCGARAYTWKTAYDADYAKYSPGAVLVDKATEDLLSGAVESIESCSPEGGFMSQIWEGRRRTAGILAGLAGERSSALAAVAAYDRSYAAIKQARDMLRSR